MDNNSQRRILGVGGVLWILAGVLGLVASNVADGMNPLLSFGPLAIGIIMLGFAVKGWGKADGAEPTAEETSSLPLRAQRKHA